MTYADELMIMCRSTKEYCFASQPRPDTKKNDACEEKTAMVNTDTMMPTMEEK